MVKREANSCAKTSATPGGGGGGGALGAVSPGPASAGAASRHESNAASSNRLTLVSSPFVIDRQSPIIVPPAAGEDCLRFTEILQRDGAHAALRFCDERADALHPDDAEGHLQISNKTAQAYRRLHDLGAARRTHVLARPHLSGARLPETRAHHHHGLGLTLLNMGGNAIAALEEFGMARTLFTRAGLPCFIATADNNAGLAKLELGELDEAEALMKRARSIAEGLGDEQVLKMVFDSLKRLFEARAGG